MDNAAAVVVMEAAAGADTQGRIISECVVELEAAVLAIGSAFHAGRQAQLDCVRNTQEALSRAEGAGARLRDAVNASFAHAQAMSRAAAECTARAVDAVGAANARTDTITSGIVAQQTALDLCEETASAVHGMRRAVTDGLDAASLASATLQAHCSAASTQAVELLLAAALIRKGAERAGRLTVTARARARELAKSSRAAMRVFEVSELLSTP
jgi:hypothetical protein